MTKVELEKISNADMHLFVEKGIREGISYVTKIYSKANSKYCPDYDKEKPEKYIIYDMNLRYDMIWIIYMDMQWVKINNETVNRILNKSDNSLHGYFLEVDLDYPKYLYDSHKHYPMALEKIKIKVEWLSPYCSEIKNKHDIKTRNINKLAPNLMPKKNYVVHYRTWNIFYQKDWH